MGAAINKGRLLRALSPDVYAAKLREQIKSHISLDGQCWIWTASRQRNGYGQSFLFGNPTPAHRVSYIAFKGEITVGLEVMHSCANRSCVNPDHLSLGTHQQNMRDARMPSGHSHHMYGQIGRRGTASNQSIPVVIGETQYDSFGEAARKIGVAKATIGNWIKSGKAQISRSATQ